MGSKPTNSTTTSNTSTYSPPAWLSSNLQNITNQANSVASTPYQAYSGELVAGLNGQQNTGISAVNSASGIQNGYNSAATGLAGASAGAIDPTQFSASQIQQYESPYNTDVVNSTLAQINNQNAQQQASLKGNMISSGAFGGDRAGVAAAALGGQQALATNQTIAGLNNQNYQQALSEFNNQQQTNLSAQQNTAARQLAASQQLGTLGSTAQTEALNEANAQVNAGTLQQQTQQAQDTAAYNQYLQQMAYPFQTTSWLANLVGGLGGLAGGTSTSNGSSQTDSSIGSSILGGLIGLGGIFAPSKAHGGAVGGGLAGPLPHKAGGGGLAGGYNFANGGGLGGSIPYATGATEGLGGGSWVPDGAMQAGHLSIPQSGGSMGGGLAGQSQTPQQMGQSIAQTANGLKGLGSAFSNSSIGDSFNDWTQDTFGFANGGLVPPAAPGALSFRPAPGLAGYASGGLVTRPQFGDGGEVGNLDNTPVANARCRGLAGNTFANGGLVLGDGGLMGRPHFDDGGSVDDAIAQASAASGVPLPLARAMAMQESSMNPNAPHGGLMQILPSTARDPGYGMSGVDPATLNDPYANARFGLGYMAAKNPNTDWNDPAQVATALQRYNGGGDPDYVQHVLSHIPGGLAGDGTQPLAYDSAPTGLAGASGVQAINNVSLGGGLAGGSSDASNATGLAPNGSSNSDWGSGLLPKGSLGSFGISDNMRQALLAAGLGMMGGTSRNAFVNIGQGGLAGINAYNTAQQTQAKTGLANAQAKGADLDNQFKQARVQALTQALKDQQVQGQANAQRIQNQASGPSPSSMLTTPTVTAGSGPASNPASNVTSSQAAALDPTWDPSWNLKQAQYYATLGLPEVAKPYQDRADLVLRIGMTRDMSGRMVPLPGYTDAQGQIEGAKTAARVSAENSGKPEVTPNGYTFIRPQGQSAGQPPGSPSSPSAPAQPQSAPSATDPSKMTVDPKTATVSTVIPQAPAGGGYPVPDIPAGAKLVGVGDAAKELAKSDSDFKDIVGKGPALEEGVQRFRSLAQAFKLFQSGPGAERTQGAAAIAQWLGYPDIAKKVMGGDPAALEWVNKEGVNLTLNTLSAANPRFAQSEFKALASNGTPNPTLLPEANHQMISEGLGLALRNQAFVKDWEQARNAGWQSPSAFFSSWSQANPLSGFIGAAQKQVGNFKGMDLPPSNEWTAGTTYVVPSTLSAQQKQVFAKRGLQPGQMFKFNGRDVSNSIQPIAPAQNYTSYLH